MKAATALSNELPGPSVRPHRHIVVYDGHCRFCVSQMRLLAQLDRTEKLAYLSLHHSLTDLLLPDLSLEQRMQAMIVIDQRGKRYAGADAVRHLSRVLPLLWPAAPVLHIPGSRPFWRWLYARIAQVRYRFGRVQCDGGTCQLH